MSSLYSEDPRPAKKNILLRAAHSIRKPAPSAAAFDTQSVSSSYHLLRDSSETPDPNLPPKSRKTIIKYANLNRSFKDRFGIIGLISIFAGIPVQVAIMSFIAFLWSCQDNVGTDNSVWRSILLADRMPTTVTLAAMILRVIIAYQLLLCTSVAAALVLESSSVDFAKVPNVSILRAYNGGPGDLLLLLWTRPSFFLRCLPAALIGLLYILGIALQFTSTVLVGDLGTITISTDPVIKAVPYADSTGAFLRSQTDSIWTRGLTSYPRFSEARLPNALEGADISDTGSVQRAFLPFDATDRLRLKSFEGETIVQDARTVCVPVTIPDFRLEHKPDWALSVTGNLTWSAQAFLDTGILEEGKQFDNTDDDEFSWNNVKAGTENDGTPISDNNEFQNVKFNCTFQPKQYSVNGIRGDHLQLAMCTIGARKYQQFLMLDFVGPFGHWYLAYYDGQDKLTEVSRGGGWANYRLTDAPDRDLTVRASVCGLSMSHRNLTISATGNRLDREPGFSWDGTTKLYNFTETLSLLGTTNQNARDLSRGILQHDMKTDGAPEKDGGMNDGFLALGNSRRWNNSLLFCTRCQVLPASDVVAPSYVLLMQAALEATDSPALALDALWATYSQIMYYSNVDAFDKVNKDSLLIWSVTVTGPVRYLGFSFVIAMLAIEIISILWMVLLFVRRGQYTLVGNAWQAVAQVSGWETRELLGEVGEMKDDEVAVLAAERGLGGVMLRTGLDDMTGKVEMKRRSVRVI